MRGQVDFFHEKAPFQKFTASDSRPANFPTQQLTYFTPAFFPPSGNDPDKHWKNRGFIGVCVALQPTSFWFN
jgi:hypothetical protein